MPHRPSALNPPFVKHKTALSGNTALTASRDTTGSLEKAMETENNTDRQTDMVTLVRALWLFKIYLLKVQNITFNNILSYICTILNLRPSLKNCYQMTLLLRKLAATVLHFVPLV